MTTTPRFTIRSLLFVTVIVAISALPLAAPSKWWMLAFPTLSCWFSIFVISRFEIAPTRGQMFWLCSLVGSAFYLASVVIVTFVNPSGGWSMRGGDVWSEWMARPLWRQMHGDSAFFTNPLGIEDTDFKSFFLFVQVTAALAASVVAAGAAQLVAHRRGTAVKKSRFQPGADVISRDALAFGTSVNASERSAVSRNDGLPKRQRAEKRTD
jgi:hypothetical protein